MGFKRGKSFMKKKLLTRKNPIKNNIDTKLDLENHNDEHNNPELRETRRRLEKLNLIAERTGMAAEEKMQLYHGDRFWGMDNNINRYYIRNAKQSIPKKINQVSSVQSDENGLIRNGENLEDDSKLHDAWMKKAAEQQKVTLEEEVKKNEEARLSYMRTFWSTTSSKDIISHNWWSTNNSVSTAVDTTINVSFPSGPNLVTTSKRNLHHKFNLRNPIKTEKLSNIDDGLIITNDIEIKTFHNLNTNCSVGRKSAYDVEDTNNLFPELPAFGSKVVKLLDLSALINTSNLGDNNNMSNEFELMDKLFQEELNVDDNVISPNSSTNSNRTNDEKKAYGIYQNIGLRETKHSGFIPKPLNGLCNLRFVTARGWVFVQTPSFSWGGYENKKQPMPHKKKAVYCALWRTSILYFFKNEGHCNKFFSSNSSDNNDNTNSRYRNNITANQTPGDNTHYCIDWFDIEVAISIKCVNMTRIISNRHTNGDTISSGSSVINSTQSTTRWMNIISPWRSINITPVVDVQFSPWYRTFANAITARNALMYSAGMQLKLSSGTNNHAQIKKNGINKTTPQSVFDNVNNDIEGVLLGDVELIAPVDTIEVTAVSANTLEMLKLIQNSKLQGYAAATFTEEIHDNLNFLRLHSITVGCVIDNDSTNNRLSCSNRSVTRSFCDPQLVITRTPHPTTIRGAPSPRTTMRNINNIHNRSKPKKVKRSKGKATCLSSSGGTLKGI